MEDFVYIPGPKSDFLELSRTKSGKLFRKHILNKGELIYPGVSGGKVNVDDAFMSKLVENFENRICDIVQVPLAGKNNEHTEAPDRNIGEVVDLKIENDKVYAYIDARDDTAASKIGKTILGASALLNLNYTDTKTGLKAGPTLLHVAMTNRPYITELEEFEELLAASAADSDDTVVLTAVDTEEIPMTKEELIAELAAKHDIDVAALSAKAEQADEAIALSNSLTEALKDSDVVQLTNGEIKADDLVAAVAQLATDRVELSNKVNGLVEANAKDKASSRVAELVKDGFILPKNEAASVTLLLSNSELFEDLLPEKPIVSLSVESGVEEVDESIEAALEAEAVRLSNIANGVTA